jgi:hypothetical protein|tara:strand:- start:5543 stop:7255 length:1713 start_codon:yes stop_codon:yes gene_type:complete
MLAYVTRPFPPHARVYPHEISARLDPLGKHVPLTKTQLCAELSNLATQTLTVSFQSISRIASSGTLHKIAFKRGIFPGGFFTPSDRFGGAEELKANGDPVARRLLDQLGKGVFAAIKAKYARTITYYVMAPELSPTDDSEIVLEEYQFTIKYDSDDSGKDDATVEEVAVRGTSKDSKKTLLDDEENIKDAGDQMLRQLEVLISNLDPLPEGAKIGIRMAYVENVPPEYEPPFFEAAAPPSDTNALADAEAFDCGSVETRFHTIALRWKTGGRDGEEDVGVQEKENTHVALRGTKGDNTAAAQVPDENTNAVVASTKALAGADANLEDGKPPLAKQNQKKHPPPVFHPPLPGPRSYPNDLPFESQAEPGPSDMPRDYHYQSEPQTQSEPQSESQGGGELRGFSDALAMRAPALRQPSHLTGSIGLSMSQGGGRRDPTSSKRSPSSPFGTLGSGFKKQKQSTSFSFGNNDGGASVGGSQFSRESLGGVLFGRGGNTNFGNGSGGFGGGFGSFGGGFGSPIRRGTRGSVGNDTGHFDFDAARVSAAADNKNAKTRKGFPSTPEAPWKKRLRSK